MSDYRTRAVATIDVNGNAGKQISRLKQRTEDFRDAIAQAYKEGNDKLAKKLTRELKATEKELRTMQSQTANVEMTLRRLDKATPKELRQTLRSLEKDLQKIERGSAAWNAQTQKIRQVRAELDKVNAELKVSGSRWERFNATINNWQTTIMGAAAAVTGFVMAGKAAVQVYADIDQEMASVRKYTGMTEEQVRALNDEFKKIDTRTSREDLNKLAQEAGRLGLQSQEDVLGFVRAANQINVALDDLGDGATLTLSKLTDIFGDKQRLGVEQSLMAVGSVINELSQNCTASAPYIAEFASRMGGVGKQAGMSIQQIMGLAAVLDSNNQKLEASSTAVSQVLVRMYREPAKYAKVAGLDVQKFTALIKKDANAALLEFLEALHKAGGMDVLSPMFKDMGENGARAITALSTLAANIDKVKWEQAEAAKAFEEATSVTKEYEVQNNTVQAQLDKARKGFTEMAATLGEKLMPVMRYFISSTSAMMRGMSAAIDFFIKYKSEILMLTVTIASYTVAVKAAAIQTKAHAAAQTMAKVATTAWTAVTQLAYAAVALLSGNLKKATMEMRIFAAVIHASPVGLLVAGITAACAGLLLMVKRYGDNVKAATEAAAKQREYLRSLRDVDTASKNYSESEVSRLRALYSAAMNEKLARDKRLEAVKQMQSLYPSVFSNFSTEEIMAGKAKNAYDQLTDSIIKNARARAAAEKILENEKAILELEEENKRLRDDNKDRRQQAESANRRRQERARQEDANRPINQEGMVLDEGIQDLDRSIRENVGAIKDNNKQLNENNKKIQERKDANKWLQEQYNVTGTESAEPAGNPPTVSYVPKSTTKSGKGSGSKKAEDKFKAEKEWREREEALNAIAYRTGEKNFEEYTNRLLEIERDFYEKQLAHTDLGETERLKIMAQFHEVTQKMLQQNAADSIEEETREYEERKAEVQQFYLDGFIDAETYNGKLEELEIRHLGKVADIRRAFAEAHPEDEKAAEAYAKADKAYRDALAKDQMKNRKALQDKEKAHTEKLREVWDEYFVSDEEKRQEYYNQLRKLLEEAYKAEIAKAGYTAEEKLEIERRYQQAMENLRKEEEKKRSLPSYMTKEKYEPMSLGDRAKKKLLSPLKDILKDDELAAIDQTLDHVYNSFASLYESLGQLWQQEEQMKLAALEKRYDREISMAEGNAYKVKQLERKKAREEAQIKADAQRRMFAQQVLSAVAQTATAAINAYSSAAAIPYVGMYLAPVAAALAIAAGTAQIATIKQQQSLSNAQGFAKGGFTPDGPEDQPVGVVHAGEWVASKKLVDNPATRPAIDALEFAQRNNRFGSLRTEDVTRTITAPAIIAGAAADGSMERAITAMAAVMGRYGDTMERLGERLNEPFVTVNTVSGDHGIKQAQDEYQRLQNNTLPKSKRK